MNDVEDREEQKIEVKSCDFKFIDEKLHELIREVESLKRIRKSTSNIRLATKHITKKKKKIKQILDELKKSCDIEIPEEEILHG